MQFVDPVDVAFTSVGMLFGYQALNSRFAATGPRYADVDWIRMD